MDADIEQPPPSSSTLDTDSSLRAAALLSRKRRRVAADARTLPPRLAPEPSLHLDYGIDDPVAFLSNRMLSPQPTTPELTDHVEDVEDGQIREEGEISDTESSLQPRRSPTPPPRLRQRFFSSQHQASVKVENPLALGSSSHIEAPIPSALESSGAQPWQAASLEPIVLETPTYRLDANHVRPGLTMTLDQYNTAKENVLDLLGWGVPPEYLLECGLSRHVVFYVFSELNLRFPSNLDTSGLIPYPTPEMLALFPISPSLSAHSLHSSSSTMPPPSVIPARISLAERMSMEHIDTRMSSPDPSPYIKAEPSSPSSAELSNSHSLLAIEQQRRQELLARKAAVASRKARQSEILGFLSPTKDQDFDISVVHAQSVDDFLKTIEPVQPLSAGSSISHNQRSSIETNSFSNSDRMDVDGLVPGFIGVSGSPSVSLSGPPSSQLKPSSVTTFNAEFHSPTALPIGSTRNMGSAGNGIERGSVTSVDTTASDPRTPTLQGNPGYSSLEEESYPQRRGIKRPVAADFVDFEGGLGSSRGIGSSASNGHSNGGSYPNPPSRRKVGSFGGISGMRRCVIDLSDSEDEGDSQVMGDQVGNGDFREYSPAVTTPRVPPRLTTTPAVTSSLGSSVVANGSTAQLLPGAPTTNALAEKEEEIKRMRQLIAQREESRLKKLAALPGKSTPVMPFTADIRTVVMKRDEAPISSVGHDNLSTLPPSRGQDNNRHSIAELTRRHGYELFVPDGDCEDEQDLLVAEETDSAQVVSPSKEDIDQESLAAGDSGASSSAQVTRPPLPQSQNEAHLLMSRSGFPLYDSPLSRYPLLRPRFGPETSGGNATLVVSPSKITSASQASARSTTSVHFPCPISCSTGSVCSHSCSPVTLPDLKELKQVALYRWLAQVTRRSPDLRVCHYEVPGGGVCRDKDCGELHLSQLNEEPSDTEVAAYVHGKLPLAWNGRCDVRAIEVALKGVRQRGGATDVDGRLREALGGLGIPMT